MSDMEQYLPPVPLGAPMRGGKLMIKVAQPFEDQEPHAAIR